MNSVEICAGAGGQALGLEQAGFNHLALVELDSHACSTLRLNRPKWNVLNCDVKEFDVSQYKNIDLLAGGVPCPPFSIAGKQLGHNDERDLFPEVLRLVEECYPKAVMVENVRGILAPKFDSYRKKVLDKLRDLGYTSDWRLVNSSDYRVSQLRPRAILIAMRPHYMKHFIWPDASKEAPPTVGEILYKEMHSNGWEGATEWKKRANNIAPTLVGGSKKHGGADLGPTRAKLAWSKLDVDGLGIADEAPDEGFTGKPRLTVRMASLIQGFPPEWEFAGRKTASYRQVGNAFPPPVAKAIGISIRNAIIKGDIEAKN